jgi:hypothetical protein
VINKTPVIIAKSCTLPQILVPETDEEDIMLDEQAKKTSVDIVKTRNLPKPSAKTKGKDKKAIPIRINWSTHKEMCLISAVGDEYSNLQKTEEMRGRAAIWNRIKAAWVKRRVHDTSTFLDRY